MNRAEHDCDCIIVGAGVVGLWLRALLAKKGYRVVTVEKSAAGDGQTIASQGILHRGLKYRVSPDGARAASRLQIAESMWNDALAGRGPIDLAQVNVVAERMHMWAPSGGIGGMLAKATASMASLVMTADARRLASSQWPEAFHGAHHDTVIFEVVERCVDIPTLVRQLMEACQSPILRSEPSSIELKDNRVTVTLESGESVTASSMFACAGAGNERLLELTGNQPGDIMQRRPLAMVAAANAPCAIYGHCIKPMSDKPRITVTTTVRDGTLYWWLGGSLAEDGVGRSDEDQIVAAREMLSQCVPWINTSSMRFSIHRIDRAEGRMRDGSRPDGPVIHSAGPAHFVWPTKLALAPLAAATCVEKLTQPHGITFDDSRIQVEVAEAPWLKVGVRWK